LEVRPPVHTADELNLLSANAPATAATAMIHIHKTECTK
jgi:hypothetical protein